MTIAPVHTLPHSGNTGIVPPWLTDPVHILPVPFPDEPRILPVGDAVAGAFALSR